MYKEKPQEVKGGKITSKKVLTAYEGHCFGVGSCTLYAPAFKPNRMESFVLTELEKEPVSIS